MEESAQDTTNAEAAVEKNEDTAIFEQDKKDVANPAKEEPKEEEASKEEPEKEGEDKEEEPSKEYEAKDFKSKDLSLDDERLEKIVSLSKERGFTKEQTQELVSTMNESVTSFKEEAIEKFEAQKEQWLEDIKSDKEIGGEKLRESIHVASVTLDKFSTPEFKKQLDESGFGNHPELVRVFSRIGRELDVAGDSIVRASAKDSSPKPFESIFYPEDNNQ